MSKLRPWLMGTSLLLLVVAPVFAQGGSSLTAQAFATYYGATVTGAEGRVWTAVQPAGWFVIASPVGVCTTNAARCSGYYAETGYLKGTISTNQPNVLQQFTAWRTTSGVQGNQYYLGNLSDNTWYTFRVDYCGQNYWCAYRNGTQVHRFYVGFSSGGSSLGGGEGGGGGVPMGVEVRDRKIRNAGSVWVLVNYNGTQTTSIVPPHQYCVTQPYAYGSISWKCY